MKELELKEVEKTVESIPMGQKAYFSKTVTEGDVALFAGITGAFDPLSLSLIHICCGLYAQRICI